METQDQAATAASPPKIATKDVMIMAYPYYDGRRMWPIGDVLRGVPTTFGMKKKIDLASGKQVIENGKPQFVESDNFKEIRDGERVKSHDNAPIFSGARLDPNLGGMDPNLMGLDPGTPTDGARVQIMPSPAEAMAAMALEARVGAGQGMLQDANSTIDREAIKAELRKEMMPALMAEIKAELLKPVVPEKKAPDANK